MLTADVLEESAESLGSTGKALRSKPTTLASRVLERYARAAWLEPKQLGTIVTRPVLVDLWGVDEHGQFAEPAQTPDGKSVPNARARTRPSVRGALTIAGLPAPSGHERELAISEAL